MTFLARARNHAMAAFRTLGLMPMVNSAANLWFRAVKTGHRLRGRSHAEAIYSHGYFDAEEAMTLGCAAQVVDCLIAELGPTSVADVGCGTGVYLAHLEERGVEIQGFEWSEAAIRRARVEPTRIRRHDLREPLETGRTYDLVVCFEVAEHLEGRHADELVSTVCRLGPTVAFSAAQPGQGGTDHVNEQPPAYWIRRFEARGYRHREERTRRLRAELAERNCVWWLPKNLLVFEKDGVEAGGGP